MAATTISDCGNGAGTVDFANPDNVDWTCQSVCTWDSVAEVMQCNMKSFCDGTDDQNVAYLTSESDHYVFTVQCDAESNPVGGQACCAMEESIDGEITGFEVLGTNNRDAIGLTNAGGDTLAPIAPAFLGVSITALVKGEDGDDYIVGSKENADIAETLEGGEDHDDIRGDRGDDDLYGNEGTDYIEGDEGSDKIFGNEGQDFLQGGVGVGSFVDRISGGTGNDRLCADTISGSPPALPQVRFYETGFTWKSPSAYFPDPTVDYSCNQSNNADDELAGGPGNDRLFGNEGNNRLEGRGGHDYIEGGDGDDQILGGSGSDEMYGGVGDDEICDLVDEADMAYGDDDDDEIFLDDSNGTAFIDGGADFDDCSPLENCEVSNLTACPFTP